MKLKPTTHFGAEMKAKETTDVIFKDEQPGDWLHERREKTGIFRGIKPSDWPKPKN